MPRKQNVISSPVVAVPTPGTPIPLSLTPLYVTSFIIKASPGNVGFMYVGGNQPGSTMIPMEPGRSMELWGDNLDNGTTALINLAEVFVDADNPGEDVILMYLGGY